MISRLVHRDDYNKSFDLRGLSTDSKPTSVPNGSSFIEIDTGKGYLFDEENKQWIELQSGGAVVIPIATGVMF